MKTTTISVSELRAGDRILERHLGGAGAVYGTARVTDPRVVNGSVQVEDRPRGAGESIPFWVGHETVEIVAR